MGSKACIIFLGHSLLNARMRLVWSIQKENIPWTFPPPPPINRGASPLSKTTFQGRKSYHT
jgi:hypothetical protein